MNEEKFYNNCFTEIEEGKVNSKFNKTTMKCFDSEDNKFSMDCEGNLVVNSIITRETNFDAIYPVGSVYISVNNINPSTLFGGTWEQIKDRFLLGCGNMFALSSTGGETQHKLTKSEMPNFQLDVMDDNNQFPVVNSAYPTVTGWNAFNKGGVDVSGTPLRVFNNGGDQPHNNMPPYLAVSVWKRIA